MQHHGQATRRRTQLWPIAGVVTTLLSIVGVFWVLFSALFASMHCARLGIAVAADESVRESAAFVAPLYHSEGQHDAS